MLSRTLQPSRKGVQRHILRSALLIVKGINASETVTGVQRGQQCHQIEAILWALKYIRTGGGQGWGEKGGCILRRESETKAEKKELYTVAAEEGSGGSSAAFSEHRVAEAPRLECPFHLHCWVDGVCLITRRINFERCLSSLQLRTGKPLRACF